MPLHTQQMHAVSLCCRWPPTTVTVFYGPTQHTKQCSLGILQQWVLRVPVCLLIRPMFHLFVSIKCKLLIIKFPSSQPSPEVAVVPPRPPLFLIVSGYSFLLFQPFTCAVYAIGLFCSVCDSEDMAQGLKHAGKCSITRPHPQTPNVSSLFYVLHLDSIKQTLFSTQMLLKTSRLGWWGAHVLAFQAWGP